MRTLSFLLITIVAFAACKKDDSSPFVEPVPLSNPPNDRSIDGEECNMTSHNDVWVNHHAVTLPEMVPAGATIYVYLHGDSHLVGGNTTWSPFCYTLKLNGNTVATFTGSDPEVFEYLVP